MPDETAEETVDLRDLVDDLDAEVARLTPAGVPFRNDVVRGPGGAQVLAVDPAGNLVERFRPAARP